MTDTQPATRTTPIEHDFFGDPSSDRFVANERRALAADLEPCVTCGRGVAVGKGFLVCVTSGGSSFVHPDDAELEETVNRSGFMGWYAVGSSCVKPIPAEFRAPLDAR